MDTRPNFKINVLEDNDFYNKLIRGYIDRYIGSVALSKGFTFEVLAYTTFNDWQRNFNPDTDVIITDYYLNEGHNALEILEEVKRVNANSKVIVISQMDNLATTIGSMQEGACEFIYKDKTALERSGYVIEEILNENLKQKYGSMPFN